MKTFEYISRGGLERALQEKIKMLAWREAAELEVEIGFHIVFYSNWGNTYR